MWMQQCISMRCNAALLRRLPHHSSSHTRSYAISISHLEHTHTQPANAFLQTERIQELTKRTLTAAAAACRNAWSQLGQLQQHAAKEQYIEALRQQDPQWLAAAAAGSSGAAAGAKKGSSVGGPVFSTLVHSGDEQQQQQQVREGSQVA